MAAGAGAAAAAVADTVLADLAEIRSTYTPKMDFFKENYYGVFTPQLVTNCERAERTNERSGGSGTGSRIEIALSEGVPKQQFYFKEMKMDEISINERNKDKILGEFSEAITKIRKEILINLDVTERIPDYVSKCLGSYIKYSVENEKCSYTIFILFEFLPGFTVEQYLNKYLSRRREPGIVIPQRERIVASIKECLDALHAIGYVHHDIKPDNIYVVSGDNLRKNEAANGPVEIERCVLIDFGETLRIGETLDVHFDKLAGDPLYNPYAGAAEGFPWEQGVTQAHPKENLFALEAIKKQKIPLGFQMEGGKRRTTRKTRKDRKNKKSRSRKSRK